MTKTLVSLIVGSHFVPPAKILLENLPTKAPLELVAEPENPYDANAIVVLVNPSAIPASRHETLREILPTMGHDWDEILAEGRALSLGHIASSEGKPLLQARALNPALVGTLEILPFLENAKAWFSVGSDGKALVNVEIPE